MTCWYGQVIYRNIGRIFPEYRYCRKWSNEMGLPNEASRKCVTEAIRIVKRMASIKEEMNGVECTMYIIPIL